jgi:hypothetical protein
VADTATCEALDEQCRTPALCGFLGKCAPHLTKARPDDLYEQRLDELHRLLPGLVQLHDDEHQCAEDWCEYRYNVMWERVNAGFDPAEAEAFATRCPYVWDWVTGDCGANNVREFLADALRYDAFERLIDHRQGDPSAVSFVILDPATTWTADR